MADTSSYFDAIDNLRLQRALELSAVKHSFTTDARPDPFSIRSKSVVVLVYANWEGFYNECVTSYVDFLATNSIRVSTASWNLLVGAMSGEFNALRDRHHSNDAKRAFIESLKGKLICTFDQFDRKTVQARSNLNFDTLRAIFQLLDFDILPFLPARIRLDKELVGWRHAVAHGAPPDLRTVDVEDHIDFASNLLLQVADTFQTAILAHV
jgi:hypothetical protein